MDGKLTSWELSLTRHSLAISTLSCSRLLAVISQRRREAMIPFYGTIKSGWTALTVMTSYDVTVPANTSATLRIQYLVRSLHATA